MSRKNLDNKTTRSHAEAIHSAGIRHTDFMRARLSMTYRLDYGWGGTERGMYYRHRHYLTRVGKHLRRLERGQA